MKYLDKLLAIFGIFIILRTVHCAYDEDDDCDSFKAKYLNEKIRHLLGENHRIIFVKIQLEETYNELLRKLQSVMIRKQKPSDACIKAEEALKKFQQFMREYPDLKTSIELLQEKLKKIEETPHLDKKDKFEAFRLSLILEDSATITAAKDDIKTAKDFLNRILGAANAVTN